MSSSCSTAAAIIIADEVLTGKILDTNSNFLAKLLFEQGVQLKRVSVIPDDVDDIVKTVREASANHTYVFTSGGIGPTHDDKTYDALAKAFTNGKMELHQKTLDLMTESLRLKSPTVQINQARKRMAIFPSPCSEVLFSEGLWVPIVVVNRNVHVLPGIPELFQRMLLSHRDRFVSSTKLYRRIVYTLQFEGDIADPLTELQQSYPNVAIGSYPVIRERVSEVGYNVKITLEGIDPLEVDSVAEQVLSQVQGYKEPIPPGKHVHTTKQEI